MAQLLNNNARALLVGNILAADTTFTVESSKADSFPVANTGTSAVNTAGLDWYKAVLQDTSGNVEIIYVRTRAAASGVMSNVIRAQEGTTARNFAASSICELRITSLDLQNAIIAGTNASALAEFTRQNTTLSPAFSATPTFDAAAAYNHLFGLLTANVTAVTISNPVQSRDICIRVKQNGVGGFTWTHPAGSKGAGSIGTLPNQVSEIYYKYNLADTRWEYTVTPVTP